MLCEKWMRAKVIALNHLRSHIGVYYNVANLLTLLVRQPLILFIIECRVECIKVFAAQIILSDAQTLTKALVVYNLSGTQEADRISDLRILYQTKDIIIGGAGFLPCCNHVRTT